MLKIGKMRKIEEQLKRYAKEGPVKMEIYCDPDFDYQLMVVTKIKVRKTTEKEEEILKAERKRAEAAGQKAEEYLRKMEEATASPTQIDSQEHPE